MTHKPLLFSLFCTILTIAVSAYAWFNLPVLESYPLRWNAAGEANQFGSREDVLILLSIFPFVALGMTLLFALLPRVEPLRGNLEESKKPYGLVWMLCMALILFVATMIALSYATEQGGKIGSSPRLVVTALSLFFIGVGNVLGKVRQNFMFGIRTPWTLSSELSWEKTHRIGARLFVATGVVSLITALALPILAFPVFIISLLLSVTACLVISYREWRNDPDKRTA
ncbi:SdpI family protein [Parasphingorhabdus sp.]|uniref:SdpI family protein n=1 Tax=Parasphingorhabdus sp. TaxID=2709688 RepID=UPI003BAE7D58